MQRIACSVLISVWRMEKPEYLCQCLDSVFGQSRPPDEVILVGDGPLTAALHDVIGRYTDCHPEMRFVPLPDHCGLSAALNEGLRHCRHDLVARMDTDDLCCPDRLEVQCRYLSQHPECDVLGGWTDEFCDTPSCSVSMRRVPERHDDIVRFGRRRCPMNHPTVLFRREIVMAVGGYRDVYLFEDYDLWVRLIKAGYHFHNLQRPLIHFRVSNGFFARRSGWHYIRSEVAVQRAFHKAGYLTGIQMTQNILVRTLVRMLPHAWQKRAYLVLRNHSVWSVDLPFLFINFQFHGLQILR